MSSKIIDTIISQGGFAAMFSYLLLYVLKQNSIREDRYQILVQELTNLLPDIKQDIEGIKNMLKIKI